MAVNSFSFVMNFKSDEKAVSNLSPHGDLRDITPLADALGVVGVDGAVAPFGGGGGEGFGVDVVGAGVDG